jgi:hypothetical protein
VAAGALVAMPATAAATGPDPVNQPLADGCQRNPAGLLTYTSPEWVFVHGKSPNLGDTVRVIEGTASLTHTADEDLPEGHLSYDLDSDVTPDPAYRDLLAGDPNANGGQGNGNWANDADRGKLHVEWESGVVPTFVWPTEGDRVKFWGQWIWDCGHWGQGIQTDRSNPQGSFIGTGDYFLPGQIEGAVPPSLRGEQTELHPMQAMVVTRKSSYRAAANERETDVFASSDGTHALAEERCARQLTPLPGLASYGPDFAACANATGDQRQDLSGRSYTFFAPAPPKPSPGAVLRYREVKMVSGHGYTEAVEPVAGGINVTVKFGPNPSGAAQSYGTSFFVGWEGHPAGEPVPDHLRFTLKSVKVLHSLDPNQDRPQQSGPPPGEYNLYMDLNGFWNFIGGRGFTNTSDSSWVPGLGAVTDGQAFTVNRSVDFYVPPGAPVRLEISGRECDLPRMDPCLVNGEVSDGNDHPGLGLASFASAQAALGDHVLHSPVNDNYELAYSLSKAPPATDVSPPGGTGVPSSSAGGSGGVIQPPPSGCHDLYAPRSGFDYGHVRASHRFIALRGRTRDPGCAKIKRVGVALALRTHDGRCRFLLPTGHFAHRGSCRKPVFLAVHGLRNWRFARHGQFPRGRYLAWASGRDGAGNVELPSRRRHNPIFFALR